MSYKNRALWQMVVMICLLAPSLLQAASFGEVALSVGGIYPQGSFARYADPGFTISARATVHVPKVEFFVGWIGFSFAEFKSETVETRRILYEIENGPTVYRDVDQTTDENMVAGHIGLQLSTDTQRAFFRPRAALGIGVYGFRNSITWTEQNDDSTVTLASGSLDKQTSFGWRGMLGGDFYVSSQIGVTVDFIYDHVFNLRQKDGPTAEADKTSRFQGFSIGVIYMFKI